MTLRTRRNNRRLSTRKSRSGNDSSQLNGDQIEPVAASSPRSSSDSEDEFIIQTAKANLHSIKKDLHRKNRLNKAKLGTALTDLPFKKAIIAKNFYNCTKKEIADKQISNCSSVLSFNNAASSSSVFRDNITLQDSTDLIARNKNMEESCQQRPKRIAFKEVMFHGGTNDASKSKNESDTRCKRTSINDKYGTECSSNLTFKVPGSFKNRTVAYVTPGPDVNRPLSVLRRPTAGEIAVSMFGSPLLVGPDCAPTSMPQINFPTADGKVVAILPREGFTVDDMPHLATPTRHQLKTLNKYLNDLCQQHRNS